MSFFWVTFQEGGAGTIEAKDADEAVELAADIEGPVLSAGILPYPAGPYLSHIDHPAFCLTPETCQGHTACRRRPSCSE